jgi:hypothetical protein
MLNFLWDIRYILVIIVFLILFALLDWNGFKNKISQLMLAAKQMSKDGVLKNGEEQAAWVATQVYMLLPARYRLLNKAVVVKIIVWLYKQAMDYMDNGKLDGSYMLLVPPTSTSEPKTPEPEDVSDPPPISTPQNMVSGDIIAKYTEGTDKPQP